jgi:hypothetical protein
LQKISKVSEFDKDGFFVGRKDVHLFFWQLELVFFFFLFVPNVESPTQNPQKKFSEFWM